MIWREPHYITVRYATNCDHCGRRIEQGTKAYYNNGEVTCTEFVHCPTCRCQRRDQMADDYDER